MSKLKAMICECCGGRIDRDTLICNMCGAAYRLDSDYGEPIRIVEYQSKIETLGACVKIPSYFVQHDPQMAMEMSLHEMAERMVEKIMPLIEFETQFDPVYNEYITHGILRVANPINRNGRYCEIFRR